MQLRISVEFTVNAAGVEFTGESVSFHGSQLLNNAGREEISTPVLTITGAKD